MNAATAAMHAATTDRPPGMTTARATVKYLLLTASTRHRYYTARRRLACRLLVFAGERNRLRVNEAAHRIAAHHAAHKAAELDLAVDPGHTPGARHGRL